jgi:Mrp family chromosome partitioning ATPase/capsular polysaccharide biosynthesis protein
MGHHHARRPPRGYDGAFRSRLDGSRQAKLEFPAPLFTMDLLSYLRILRRRWKLIAAVAVLGLAIGAGTAFASQNKGASGRYYKASHILVSDTNSNSNSSQTSSFANLDQNALLVTSGDVPNRVGKKLGQNGRKLAEQVLVTTNSGTSTLEITAASSDANESEQLADTFATELIASITDRVQARYTQQRDRITRRLDSLQSQISDLDRQVAANPFDPLIPAQRNGVVDEYRVTFQQFQDLADKSDPTPPLSTLESAQSIPISASEYNERLQRGRIGENVVSINPNSNVPSPPAIDGGSTAFETPLSRGALGGFLGLLAGIGLALVAERLDRRLRSRLEVEEVYGQPVLAEIPPLTKAQAKKDEVVSHTSPLSRTAEAHRAIRSALVFQHVAGTVGSGGNGNGQGTGTEPFVEPELSQTEGPYVVMITSPSAKEGKTITTANLAAVYAESGASVLAVNCDFRRPMLNRYLGAPDEPRKVLQTAIPGVMLVSNAVADPGANPSRIIAAQRRVVDAAKEHFDVILLDTAPLLATNDAIEVVPAADAVVLVTRPGISNGDSALRARERLDRVHAPIVGVVMVGDDAVAPDAYYYYSSRVSREAARQESARIAWNEPTDRASDVFGAGPAGSETESSKPSS